VKDVLIGDDTITIRHSIPVPQGLTQGGSQPQNQTAGPNYLLCKGRGLSQLCECYPVGIVVFSSRFRTSFNPLLMLLKYQGGLKWVGANEDIGVSIVFSMWPCSSAG
jgi:hypothetical protein